MGTQQRSVSLEKRTREPSKLYELTSIFKRNDGQNDESTVTDGIKNQNLQIRTSPDGGYGWVIVLGCFCSMLIIGGFERTEGIYYLQFKKKFGRSAQATSWVGAIVGSMRLFLGPLAGAMTYHYSARMTCLLGSCLLFIGMLLDAFMPTFGLLFLSHAILQGFGRGFIYTPGLIILARYFNKKRGIANAMSTSGAGVGTFILAPLQQMLFDNVGYSRAFMVISVISLITVISALLYIDPSSRQSLDFGQKVIKIAALKSNIAKEGHGTQIQNSCQSIEVNSYDTQRIQKADSPLETTRPCSACLSLRRLFQTVTDDIHNLLNLDLLKNPPFFTFCLSIMLFTLANKAGFTFIPALVISKGFSESEAAFILSVSGIVDILGRVNTGLLFDFIQNRLIRPVLFSIFIYCMAILLIVLPHINDYKTINFTCGTLSALTGAFISQKTVVSMDIIGPSQISSSIGLFVCFQGIGCILGLPLSGALKDLTGDFTVSYYLCGATMICSGFLMSASNNLLIKQQLK